LVSNRDERSHREPALAPQVYSGNSGRRWFPRDQTAGGTWIAAHENGNAIVLLNGGFEYHVHKPPYSRSRGLVLLDLLDHDSPQSLFNDYSLDGVEPFTLVIRERDQLFECRWDGVKKYNQRLDETRAHIWSSATLYEQPVQQKRKGWFENWIADRNDFDLDAIMEFHLHTGDGDMHNDLLMNREGVVFTVSITGLELGPSKGEIRYLDTRNLQMSRLSLYFSKESIGE